jgi:hypothetical protein
VAGVAAGIENSFNLLAVGDFGCCRGGCNQGGEEERQNDSFHGFLLMIMKIGFNY